MSPYDDAYLRGLADAQSLPGPAAPQIIRTILNTQPDPDDNPDTDAGYRQALHDTLTQITERRTR